MDFNKFKNLHLIKISKYILSFVILFYIINYIGFDEIYSAFKKFDFLYLVIAFLLYLLVFFFNVLAIHFLYKPIFNIKFIDLFKYRSYSTAIGLFTPLRFGEFSLSLILKKRYNISIFESSAIIFLDKLISLLVVLVLFFATYFILLFYYNYSFLNNFNNYIIFTVIIALLIFLLSLAMIILLRKKKSNIRLLTKSIKRLLDTLSLLGKTYKNNMGAPLINLLITFFYMTVTAIPTYILFVSLELNINFFYLLFIASFAGLASLIPFTLSGLGVREALVIYLYSLINIDASIALAITLIFLFYRYFILLALMMMFNVSGEFNN